jgi:hypothetical protein
MLVTAKVERGVAGVYVPRHFSTVLRSRHRLSVGAHPQLAVTLSDGGVTALGIT